MLRFHGQNYWHMDRTTDTRQCVAVSESLQSSPKNSSHEGEASVAMELAQKGCVCSLRGRPAAAGYLSTLEPRWFCHKPQPLDLDLHDLFQPFFAVPSFLSLLEWNCLLCVIVHRCTQMWLWFYRVSVQTAFSLGRPFGLLNCGMTVKRLWGLLRDGLNTSLIMSL